MTTVQFIGEGLVPRTCVLISPPVPRPDAETSEVFKTLEVWMTCVVRTRLDPPEPVRGAPDDWREYDGGDILSVQAPTSATRSRMKRPPVVGVLDQEVCGVKPGAVLV